MSEKMKKLCWLLLFNTLILVLNACGETDRDRNMESKNVILYSADDSRKPLYSLTIPTNYIGSVKPYEMVILKTIYPEMVGFSPGLRDRFFVGNGSGASDRVKIFLIVKPEYHGTDRIFKNRNDGGRFAYENMKVNPSYELVGTPKNFNQSSKIKKYVSQNDKEDLGTYIILHDTQRVSQIKCTDISGCSGTTTWQGKFSITYNFSSLHMKSMVGMDKLVVDLVGTFKPTLINKGY